MELGNAHRMMLRGLEGRLFSGAVLLVARGAEVLFHEPYGILGGPHSAPVTRETLFDLASMTKILATTPCWLLLAHETPTILDQGLSTWFPDVPRDKANITPRHLLAHASGLPAWRPFYLMRFSRPLTQSLARRILAEPLVYPPGRGCLYSDLGFMLLGFIIERETGMNVAVMSGERVHEPLGLTGALMFTPDGERARTALTRFGDPPGLVNDLNARSFGGISGHAGLFGTAAGVGGIAEAILTSLNRRSGFFDADLTRTFCTRAGFTADSTRALGFDTPSQEGSTSGRFFPADSLGHTGFTGTSLWMEPHGELVVVLLTNRVLMGESDQRIKSFRPRLHDAVMEDVLGAGRVAS